MQGKEGGGGRAPSQYIAVDNKSPVCSSAYATPHDNAIAVAASAGAVPGLPATPAGRGDCAVLGTANAT